MTPSMTDPTTQTDATITMLHGDELLNAEQLADKYAADGSWGHHPKYPRSDWKQQVDNDDVICGYWQWVASEIAMEGEPESAQNQIAQGALTASFVALMPQGVTRDQVAQALGKLTVDYDVVVSDIDDKSCSSIIVWHGQSGQLLVRIQADTSKHPNFRTDVEAAATEVSKICCEAFRCFYYDDRKEITATKRFDPAQQRPERERG